MLVINVPSSEYYDDELNEFVTVKPVTVKLEHSLISLSKWESIHEKPFLTEDDKSQEEIRSYINCMVIGSIEEPILHYLWVHYADVIVDYIKAPNTATTITHLRKQKSTRTTQHVTSELIYYRMIEFNIPFDVEKWHLNRLLTLIEICHAKSSNNKMSPKEALAYQRSLNQRRRAAMNSKG